jgi:hypothetical protein
MKHLIQLLTNMKKLLLLLLLPLSLFGQTTDGTLQNEANIIKNETGTAQNTAVRIGTAFSDFNSGKMSRIENNIITGTDTYTATISWVKGYYVGLQIPVFFLNANTTSATININSFGVKNIVKQGSLVLASGDINAGQSFDLVYDGTNFQLRGGGGTTSFALLTDGPGSLSGNGLDYIRVNTGGTQLEYRTPSQALSDMSGVPTSRTVSTSAPLSGGGNLGSNLTLSFPSWPSNASGVLANNGSGTLSWSSYVATETDPMVKAINGLVKSNTSVISAAIGGTDYEFPLTFSTGLTRSTNTVIVNTSQNISTLSNLTSNGLIKTSGGTGALSIATAGTDYLAPFGSQTANFVYAAPNGSSGTPSFRALVSADLPSLSSIYVPVGRTLTINGSAQDLSADRTWTIAHSGTTNRITVTGGSGLTPTFDISSSYVGQTSLTTLGTIGTGTWQATKINLAYGGTNADLSATGGSGNYLKQTTLGGNVSVGTIPASDIVSGAAFTKTDDTNVTLTLGGTPTSAVLVPMSVTVGWSGTLSAGRLNSNVVQAITNDTNIQGSITAQNLTLTWASTLAYARFVNGSGLSVVGRSTNSAGVQADIIGTTDQVLRVNSAGTTLGFGSLDISKSGTVGSSILGIANGGSNKNSFTSGSVLFYDGTSFNENNNNFYWNAGSHLLSVNTGGDQTGTDAINVYNQIDAYLPNSSQGSFTTSGATSGFTFSSSRGTGASPSNLNAGDLVGGVSGWGYTNSAYTNAMGIAGYMTGSSSTNLGGELRFYTKVDGGSLTQRMAIANTGQITTQSDVSSSTTAIGQSLTNNMTATTGSVDLQGFTSTFTPIALGGLSNLNNLGNTNGSEGSNLSGMTNGTYTNIPFTTISGKGTGGLLSISVTGATSSNLTITAISNAGSGYQLNDAIVLWGSQFNGTTSGGGSTGSGGTLILAITAITGGNSFATTSAPQVLFNTTPYVRGNTIVHTSFRGNTISNTGTVVAVELGGIKSVNASAGTSLVNSYSLYDALGTAITLNNGQSQITLGRALNLGTNALTANNSAWSTGGGLTVTTPTPSGVTSAISSTNSTTVGFGANNSTIRTAYQGQMTQPTVGVVSAFTFSGTGTASTTSNAVVFSGGSGGSTFAARVVTNGAGTVTTVDFAGTGSPSRGNGYKITDGNLTGTIPGGTVTVTITGIDYTGNIQATFMDITSSYTDASSMNAYGLIYDKRTLNITSTQAGTLFDYWNQSTYTSVGSFLNLSYLHESTGTLGGLGITAANVKSTWDVNGSVGYAITSVSANTTLDATYYMVLVDASGGNKTITLPSASGATRRVYVILKTDNSANTVTISTTVFGSKVINTQGYGYGVISNGTSWYTDRVITP